MELTGLILIGIVVVLLVLFVIIRIIRSCLPKIVVGLLLLAGIGYFIYWYLSKYGFSKPGGF